MPDETSGQPPTGDTNKPTPAQPIPSTIEQGIMGQGGHDNTNQKPTDTTSLAKDIHWIHHATLWSQIGLGLIGLGALYIYNGQLSVMKGQLKQIESTSAQTDRLICLYQQQLAQLTKQAGDTHDLAVQAKNQADRTKDIAATSLQQGTAAATLARVAQQSNAFTEENLRAVIEPTCTIERISVGENITARCDFKNAGHSVAFNARGASDAKRWQDLPDGPMPVKIIEEGSNLAPGSESHVIYIDSLPATKEFLDGLPELTVNDDPGNETVFFFTRLEYSSLGQPHHTEICFHLTKANAGASTMPEAKTGYVLRRCRKWHSAD
jgi:hypothetical protein